MAKECAQCHITYDDNHTFCLKCKRKLKHVFKQDEIDTINKMISEEVIIDDVIDTTINNDNDISASSDDNFSGGGGE